MWTSPPPTRSTTIMLHNYLVTAWRQLRRHGAHSAINLLGLSAGIACCLLIILFVRHETSFDHFHTKSDRIYRLNKIDVPEQGPHEHHAVSSGLMGPTLVDDYPAVEAAVRLLPWFDDVVLTHGDHSTKVPALVIADRNVFEVFDFELLHGDARTALEAPMSIVLTPDLARVFFEDEDPVGRTLTGLDDEIYTVTGVVAPAPETSHIYFDVLVSWSSTVPGQGPLEYQWMNNWLTQVLYTYLLLEPSADPKRLESELPSFMERHFPERAEQYHLYLQPLKSVYLDSGHIQHARKVRSGGRTYVVILSVIGGLVLFIAGINFVNLSTARAARRLREVGIRKTLGATRLSVSTHFMAESVLLCVVATFAAVLAVVLVLPSFVDVVDRELTFAPWRGGWVAALTGGALVVGLAAGAYPAASLSRHLPVTALRGSVTGGRGGIRHVLVTAQFTISITLLIGTAMVYRQMQFVQTKDLGFEADQVLVLNTGGTQIEHQHEPFTDRLRAHTGIEHVAAGRNVPGHGTMEFGLEPEGLPTNQVFTSSVVRITSPSMKEALGLRMARGRFFSDDRPADLQHGVVINEALARSLGWEDPVGKRLAITGELEDGVVIGMVEDFHFESLHRPIAPSAIIVDDTRAGYVLARVNPQEMKSGLDHIRRQWEAFESRYPFEYRFMDDAFGAFYASEQKLMSTLGLFAVLAVLIGCLGLWGLAAYLAEERTKEIGIRKVLGATVSRILMLLTKETVGLVMVAFAIATPVSYLLVKIWLRNFAYHADVSPIVFLVAGMAALLLAVGTVSYQALRAATANPVTVLRDE